MDKWWCIWSSDGPRVPWKCTWEWVLEKPHLVKLEGTLKSLVLLHLIQCNASKFKEMETEIASLKEKLCNYIEIMFEMWQLKKKSQISQQSSLFTQVKILMFCTTGCNFDTTFGMSSFGHKNYYSMLFYYCIVLIW